MFEWTFNVSANICVNLFTNLHPGIGATTSKYKVESGHTRGSHPVLTALRLLHADYMTVVTMGTRGTDKTIERASGSNINMDTNVKFTH